MIDALDPTFLAGLFAGQFVLTLLILQVNAIRKRTKTMSVDVSALQAKADANRAAVDTAVTRLNELAAMVGTLKAQVTDPTAQALVDAIGEKITESTTVLQAGVANTAAATV